MFCSLLCDLQHATSLSAQVCSSTTAVHQTILSKKHKLATTCNMQDILFTEGVPRVVHIGDAT